MKQRYRLSRYRPTGGRGFGPLEECVIELDATAPAPPGAIAVPIDTPLSDWAEPAAGGE